MSKLIFYSPWWDPYRSDPKHPPRCKYEWEIIEISNAIRQKPDWQSKYTQPQITEKWRAELKTHYKNSPFLEEVDSMFEFVLKELGWYKNLPSKFPGFAESGFQIGCDDLICFSDTAIPETTRNTLNEQVHVLYSLFGDDLFYHPNSNNQVVDLVHPSLYPLQYGKTPIQKDGEVQIASFNEEEIASVKNRVADWGISRRYQWIPSVFDRFENKFRIKSYINNLHPVKYKDLYGTIENIFNMAIPGINFTLARFGSPQLFRLEYPKFDDYYNDEYHAKLDEIEQLLTDTAYDQEFEELEWNKSKYIKDIPIGYKKDPETVEFDLRNFNHVKVIVKLANIELTPENPVYKGGSWHIEGCINEDIVATVLYYYEIENITQSTLSFECAFEDPPYSQGDFFYCKNLFNMEDTDSRAKYLGSIQAQNNRLLIFPNAYMHHVDAFSLADRTKKGFRKILCMFVVDPYNEIVKTSAEIPPQQPEKVWQDLVDEDLKQKISKLTNDWPMTSEKAKHTMQELMSERSTVLMGDVDAPLHCETFNLCEH